MDRVSGCLSCDRNELTDRPVREQILVTEFWRLAHAFGTPIPGWLVLPPLRHRTVRVRITQRIRTGLRSHASG
jgi:hypothetical protein